MGRIKIQNPKEKISLSIDNQLYLIMEMIKNKGGLTRSELWELACAEFITHINKDLVYQEVDLKEYAVVVKLEKLRNLEKKKRAEFKSKTLFPERIKTEIMRFLAYRKSPKEIIGLLEVYKKEAKHYTDKKPLEYLEKVIKQGKKDNFESIKYEIKKKIDSEYRFKLITGKDNKKKKKK